MSRAPESGTIAVRGGELYFERAGSGPAIVWVHAGIADSRMWNREFASFARDHAVVRYDLRGFGRSSRATQTFYPVDDLAAVLDRTGTERATIVASSVGGALALDYSLEHPDRVERLVLAAPGLGGFAPSRDPEERRVFEEEARQYGRIEELWNGGERDLAAEELRRFWCPEPAAPTLDLVRTMFSENRDEIFTDRSAAHARLLEPPAAESLGSVRAPTLVLWGDRDRKTMRFVARRVAAGVAGAAYQEVRGADHLINLSRPDAFDAAVREFLRSAAPPPSRR